MGKVIDLTGQRFGRLTVLEPKPSKNGSAYWLCRCDCGNTSIVKGTHLRAASILSCGCFRSECAAQRGRENPCSHLTHGNSSSRLYNIWQTMLQRCNNLHDQKYSRYGGRGISVCEEWKNSFQVFQEWALNNGYEEELSIDRINVNGNYEPSNCRWATMSEQQRNRTNNHFLSLNGQTKCIAAWAEITGIRNGTILRRISLGWSVEDALTVPVGQKRPKG